jgi:hypothetical protein
MEMMQNRLGFLNPIYLVFDVCVTGDNLFIGDPSIGRMWILPNLSSIYPFKKDFAHD